MPRFKHQYNASQFPKKFENSTMPSMTVPDQTMSIATILERFSKGLPITGAKVAMYDEDDDMPDPRTMDLVDRQLYKEHYQNQLQEITNTSKKRQNQSAPTAEPDKNDNKDA